MRIEDHQFKSTPIERVAGERNDCTVRTFAYAFNTSYELAHEYMREAGRKPRKGVSMILALGKHEERIKTELGYSFEKVDFRWNESYKRQPTIGKLLTELDDKMYIIIVSGHTFPMHENKVVDTFKVRKLSRAHTVYRVIKL